MAEDTRYTKELRASDWKNQWKGATPLQKELAKKFGMYGNTKQYEGETGGDWSLTYEDRSRLAIWMDGAQLGSIDKLGEIGADDRSEYVLEAADDFIQFHKEKGNVISDEFYGLPAGKGQMQDLWDQMADDPDWKSSHDHSYGHLKNEWVGTDAPIDKDGTFNIPRGSTHGNINYKESGGYAKQINFGGLAGVPDDIAEEYELDFIDEMWGTTDGEAGTEGYGRYAKGEFEGKDMSLWGLDLVRVDKNLEHGSNEHYEHITRGEVDWAHYRDNVVFNHAYREVHGRDAGELTALGNVSDQIRDIRETNEKIQEWKDEGSSKWAKWTENDHLIERRGTDRYNMRDDGSGTKVLHYGAERQVSFAELMDPNSGYYVKPGTTKEFEVGIDTDGNKIFKTFASPIEKDLSDLIYNPDDPKWDQSEDHETKLGQKVEGRVDKIRDPERPSRYGITWVGDKPKLANPTKLKIRPTITPISNVSYAQ